MILGIVMTVFAVLVGMFPKELPESSSKVNKKSETTTNESLSQQLKGSFIVDELFLNI